jgi:hypothetical protein
VKRKRKAQKKEKRKKKKENTDGYLGDDLILHNVSLEEWRGNGDANSVPRSVCSRVFSRSKEMYEACTAIMQVISGKTSKGSALSVHRPISVCLCSSRWVEKGQSGDFRVHAQLAKV